MAWIYLLIAAICEVLWLYSLKFFDSDLIKNSFLASPFNFKNAIINAVPLIGYVLFGLMNVYFFSLAMKNFSTTTVFSIWFGMTILFTALVDYFFFKETFTIYQLFFLGLILVGVLGMKLQHE